MESNYQRLRNKVEEAFSRLSTRFDSQMRCRRGCFTCCASDLSVSEVERRYIADYLQSDSQAYEAANALCKKPAHPGVHCEFLDSKGACTIYNARPIICMSHGVPMKTKTEGSPRSACPLNFSQESLEDLPADSFLDVDLTNTLLALINEKDCADQAERRTPLRMGYILQEGELI